MPLKNKYLKYQPEITLEIFTLIYNKLINSGWTEYSNKIIEVSYSQFKTQYNYLTHQQDKTFNTHVCPYEKKYAETTVQEILGYDPFVKEFVFPEKWYVRVSDKNVKDIQLFKSKSNWSDNAAKYKAVGYEGVGYNNLPENYTEITFDQFKKYVLRESIEKPKQPLKQAVHCKTQEEWDFMLSKIKQHVLNPKHWAIYTDRTCWTLFDDCCTTLQYCSEQDGYQILSFQEWCDLNGYKMESNIDLTGRHLKALIDSPQSTTYKKGDIVEIFKKESSNQYRIGKVGGVWWTYTTNNGTERQWELLPEDYKMEKEVKFEVGKWYSIKTYYNWIIKFKGLNNDRLEASWCCINKPNEKVEEGGVWDSKPTEIKELSLEEIQQYLPDNHPNKITPVIQQTRDMQKSNQEFKVGDWIVITTNGNTISKKGSITVITYNDGKKIMTPELDKAYPTKSGWLMERNIRHATPEEVNQHLISIGQIPAGEPLNNGIEPNKDGMFKHKLTLPGSSWTGLTPTNHLGAMYHGDIMGKPVKPKMILSIDNEELPMVDIIKTNSIKQLLNND